MSESKEVTPVTFNLPSTSLQGVLDVFNGAKGLYVNIVTADFKANLALILKGLSELGLSSVPTPKPNVPTVGHDVVTEPA